MIAYIPRPMTQRSSSFHVGLVQMRCSTDLDDNLKRAIEGVREAAAKGAQIICLPEIFRSQYFCQREDAALFDLAEPIPGPSTEALRKVAGELGVDIVASLFERRAPGLYHNTTALLDGKGELAGIYRKMHIPDDPNFYEKFYFTPGDLGWKVFSTDHAKIGLLICWDQWYPEAARLTAMKGAQILFYPTAIGWHPREKAEYGKKHHDAWESMHKAHAIANGVFVAAVNRIGHEGDPGAGIEFWGASCLFSPEGELLARASHDREEVIVVECDPGVSEDFRRNWPFFRDRRIDAYDDLMKRWDD